MLFRRHRVDEDDLQGNVLRAYGNSFAHAYYLFVHIEHGDSGRRWLRELCEQVTTAAPWPRGFKPEETLNVALTFQGLRALGVPSAVQATFPKEFRQGMASRAKFLGDEGESDPNEWERGWLPPKEPHVLVTVLAQDLQILRRRADALLERIHGGPGLWVVNEQEAGLMRHRGRYAREHFGFADGFSQPAIRGNPSARFREGMGTPGRRGWSLVAPGEFVLGYPGEDGLLPPGPAAPLDRSGSYMVVRKLEQHVGRFRKYLFDKAQEDLPCLRDMPMPGPAGQDWLTKRQRLLAAKIVGRWFDGRSLVLHPEPEDSYKKTPLRKINRFRYSKDPDGLRCPLGAHVRRANPRDDFGFQGLLTKRHRIIRRSMPYGKPAFDPQANGNHDWYADLLDPDVDEDERGLVFICYQSRIAQQFEVIQGRWLNNGDVFWLGHDRDFLTMSGPGTGDGEAEADPGKMTIQGSPPSFLAPQPSFVSTKGGEYFYAPGISALWALGSGYWR
jgi:Dyp-type peroxidase family